MHDMGFLAFFLLLVVIPAAALLPWFIAGVAIGGVIDRYRGLPSIFDEKPGPGTWETTPSQSEHGVGICSPYREEPTQEGLTPVETTDTDEGDE